MHRHSAYVICLGALIAACQAGPHAAPVDGRSDTRDATTRPSPTGGVRDDAPAGNSGSTTRGAPAGPHEGTRASTPPGTSRDGAPPVGGAIVDPAGAITKTPPPAGMR